MAFDVTRIREQFPALKLKDNGNDRIYLDNPGGTQVPRMVINRMEDYLIHSNANHGGNFHTSRNSDALLQRAHEAMAHFLNAPSDREIVFGPNMTTLTFAISRSLGHWFRPGDEIIVTRMDHDANVTPWTLLARDLNLRIKWLNFNRDTYAYEPEELDQLLSDRVKLMAVNYASNAIGTINDIKTVCRKVHEAGGLVYVDAVQYVPHGPTDVQDLECDFLVCSAYKFFGPHQGILWGREELLEKLPAYKVRPADDHSPGKFETGTQSHEGQAGTLGALEYLMWIGQTIGSEEISGNSHHKDERKLFYDAMQTIKEYEISLTNHLINGLNNIKKIRIQGITDPQQFSRRVPTVSFIMEGMHPSDVAGKLGEMNIFVWDGDYYAVEVINHLGLQQSGGMVRVGAVHYNTIAELDRLLNVMDSL
jgi:cysteine desulfurase family protein (TIGR01976 family)